MWIFKSNLSKDNFNNKEYLLQLNDEYKLFENEPINELSFSAFMKFSESGDRLEYENEYFQRRRMLRDFALKAWIYGDKKAIKRLEDVMWAICGEFTWVLPAHLGSSVFNETIDLFAAETAQALTEIISLLKNQISSTVTKRCVKEIRSRVLDVYMNRKEPYKWEGAKSNWSAVCGGCIAMTAMYLIEEDDAVLKITNELKSVMESYIESFSDDGACLEGLYYWNYGMMYFTSFLDLYKQRMGVMYPIDTEKISKMAEFPCKCCLGGGYTVSFSDSSEHSGVYRGLSCKLNEMYNSPLVSEEYLIDFNGDECGRWCKAVRDIAWSNESDNIVKKDIVSLENAQWSVIKKGNMCVAFKGGNNGEPHNHNDVGGIIVMKNDTILLNDLGAGKYSAKYFSADRYDILCNRSMGHSVPIIGGMEQRAGSEYCADNFVCEGNKASADISGAYGINILKKCMRTVCCNNDSVEIEDKFEVTESIDVTERFITRCDVEVKGDIVEINTDGKCMLTMQSENACDIKLEKYINAEHNGEETTVMAIDFCFTADNGCTFKVKIA